MEKHKQIYSGKAKTLYTTDDEQLLIVEFRNDATAFDGTKKASLAEKGKVNNHFNAFIMEKLKAEGIPVHFEKRIDANTSLVKHLNMIPVECVVRNIAAGSISRRLGIAEGIDLNPQVFEFFLKNDELHDPMINESHIITFNWASQNEIEIMRELTFKVNEILKPLFLDAGILLVDYKLEFGRFGDEIVLGDEFTPDGCRLWDAKTKEKMDKDRFRRDLGDVIEHYKVVAQRLGVQL